MPNLALPLLLCQLRCEEFLMPDVPCHCAATQTALVGSELAQSSISCNAQKACCFTHSHSRQNQLQSGMQYAWHIKGSRDLHTFQYNKHYEPSAAVCSVWRSKACAMLCSNRPCINNAQTNNTFILITLSLTVYAQCRPWTNNPWALCCFTFCKHTCFTRAFVQFH